ncbi:BnaA04g16040D [Brassica napus]|uniref:BnaA04g16040D protein n=1 Tax=Brassica napus TaxID=3708 RepID=A0A078GZI9_BRANA|nr:BnaA04g16040D [Brassica napus]
MEYQFHRRNAPITRVSSDQEYFGKLDKIQESGNQKRIIQPISQNLQIEPDFEENPSSR